MNFLFHNKIRHAGVFLHGVFLLSGALGALCGMLVFRHKTKHVLFTVGVPLILGLWCVLLFFLFRPF